MSRIDMIAPSTTTPATLRTAPSIFSGYSGASVVAMDTLLRAGAEAVAGEDRAEGGGEPRTVLCGQPLAHGSDDLALLLDVLVGDVEAARREGHQFDPAVASALLSFHDAELNQLLDRPSRRGLREPEAPRDLMDGNRLGDVSQDEHRPRLGQRDVEVDQQIGGLGLGQAEHPPEELLQALVELLRRLVHGEMLTHPRLLRIPDGHVLTTTMRGKEPDRHLSSLEAAQQPGRELDLAEVAEAVQALPK